MNNKYLKSILPQVIVLLMALSLMACGSRGSSGGSSGESNASQPITIEDICSTDNGQKKDILSVAASSVKIHWDNDENDCDSDSDGNNDNDIHNDKDNHDNDDLVSVKIKGEIALKCTDYTQLLPLITAGISISSQDVINEPIEFQISNDSSLWTYENSPAYTGIKKFTIDWKRPGFEYDGDINIKATSIGNDKTVIKIDPKDISTAFAVDIGAVRIEVDENGLVRAYPDSYAGLTETNKDGTITAELLFELLRDMSIFIHHGNETSEVSVAHYYQASWAEFILKGYFDPAGLESILQSADFEFSIIVGDSELTGSASIADSSWDKSGSTWHYPIVNRFHPAP